MDPLQPKLASAGLLLVVATIACSPRVPPNPARTPAAETMAPAPAAVPADSAPLSVADSLGVPLRLLPALQLEAPPPSVKRGEQIFLGAACTYCHTVEGTNASGTVGPDLTHFAGHDSIAHVLANTRENLRRWITSAQQIKPDQMMPSFDIPDPDLQSLVLYLESLQ